MSLINDYFLLYHGTTFEHEFEIKEFDVNLNDNSYAIFALILSATRKNYQKYTQLISFKTLCQEINIKAPFNINEFNYLQYCIVDKISSNKSIENINILHLSFNYLHQNNIINKEELNKLISLFEPKGLENNQKDILKEYIKESSISYKEAKEIFSKIFEDLNSLLNKDIIKELNITKDYLNNQKFSIGITGVMNAGKSTMLNALMGKEILGTAVIPETANLSVVKYNNLNSAKVFYWDKKEWNKITQSALEIESMKDFVNETNKYFKDSLESFIKDISRSDEIKIEDLPLYTSAEKSQKKCNLVKYVELGSPLDFLKDGIEIVDTPGLDDPVIQREEITKEYISKCDMMIHLMNVSQSATLKDVEFIIDALLYQNVSKLLIVITRADTVNKNQLKEVIDYTKNSIKKQLKLKNKDSKLDYILNTIEFIPISGKMALLHRTNKSDEALKSGFKIEDTGILEIEKYLFDNLFGTNSKRTELIIESIKKQLLKIIEKQILLNNYEISLLSKSKKELEEELNNFNKKKVINTKIFQSMSQDINNYKNDAKEYLSSLETFLESELIELKNIIKQRVLNDVKYSFEKFKKRPENSRIKIIVETAIKDGIVDIIRDYRYKFIKKSQDIGEQCEQKYYDLGFTIGHKNNHFDARSFFQEDFKSGFLTSNTDIIVEQIIKDVSKSKYSNLNDLEIQLEKISSLLNDTEEDIKKKSKNVSIYLIESFFETLNEPLKQFEDKLKNDEEILQQQLISYEKNEKNKDEISINIHKNIKQLQSILNSIKGLN